VVSIEEVEKYLLPHFIEFMKDQVWAIRKVCADLFSSFALRCTRKTRETMLCESFIRLLDDNSRWVKISAYKSLGPFISTFIPSKSDESVLEQQQQSDEQSLLEVSSSSENGGEKQQQSDHTAASNSAEAASASSDTNNPESLTSKILPVSSEQTAVSGEVAKIETDSVGAEEGGKQQENEYSNFVYWRNSLPSLKNILELTDDKANEANKSSASSSSPNTADNQKEASSSSSSSSIASNSSSKTASETKTPPSAGGSNQHETLSGLLNSSNLLEKIINSKSNENPNFYSSISSFYNSNNQHQQQQQNSQKTLEQLTSELKQVLCNKKNWWLSFFNFLNLKII
jgi:hypothetical protein